MGQTLLSHNFHVASEELFLSHTVDSDLMFTPGTPPGGAAGTAEAREAWLVVFPPPQVQVPKILLLKVIGDWEALRFWSEAARKLESSLGTSKANKVLFWAWSLCGHGRFFRYFSWPEGS